jgi:hypothetical protein
LKVTKAADVCNTVRKAEKSYTELSWKGDLEEEGGNLTFILEYNYMTYIVHDSPKEL